MKPAPFSPRSFFIASVTAIVVCTAIGWASWSLSASQYRKLVDQRIAEGRAAGYTIEYDSRQIFGFPRRITMRFVNLHWKTADGIDFRTDDMDVIAKPWNWNDYEAKYKNHALLSVPMDAEGHALQLSSSAGRAQARLDNDGIWHGVKLSLEEAQMGLAPNYLFGAGNIMLAATRPDQPPKSHSEVGLTADLEADDIVLPEAMPSPFGDKAEKFAVHMRVMGQVPDVRRKDSVASWNKESGVVEFDKFAMDWGVLHMNAKGTIGFDDDLQPEGAFVGTVGNPESAMQALIKGGFIAMHDQDMLASVMEMFAKPIPKGSPGMELPITVQLGSLFLGPIRIFNFPLIDWPVEPPAAN